MKRQTPEEIDKEIEDGLNIISKLKSTIIIKHLADIPTHDGLGDSFLCFIDLNSDEENSIGFTMKTDFYSGDFVISSPIFSMNKKEITDVSQSNINKIINDKNIIVNQELRDNNYNSRNILEIFEKDISKIGLPLSIGKITTLEDLIVTLSTVGIKTINSKTI
jgi:hypothetical protein